MYVLTKWYRKLNSVIKGQKLNSVPMYHLFGHLERESYQLLHTAMCVAIVGEYRNSKKKNDFISN